MSYNELGDEECDCGEDDCEICVENCATCGDNAQGMQCDGGCCKMLCSGCNVGSIMAPRCEGCDQIENGGEEAADKWTRTSKLAATEGGGSGYDDGSLDGLADFLNDPPADPVMERAKAIREAAKTQALRDKIFR